MASYRPLRPIYGRVNGIDGWEKPGLISTVLKHEISQRGTAVMKVHVLYFLFVLVGMLGAFPSIALSQPSFGCHKAGNATEKRLCADADLARLDRRLAHLYRELVDYIDDPGYDVGDRENWFAQRDKCGEDSKCIAQRYQEQIQRLSGQNPDYPAAGVFHVQSEEDDVLALYPISSGKYYISISNSEEQGTVCRVGGSAQKDGNGLRVTVPTKSGDVSFQVSLPSPGTLVVQQSTEFSALEKYGCSALKSKAITDFIFARRGPRFNWPDDAYKHGENDH